MDISVGQPHSPLLEEACKLFPDCRSAIVALEDVHHLPPSDQYWESESSHRISDILRLFFLTYIGNGENRTPLTEHDTLIFREGREADDRTTRWLGWRALLVYFILAFTGATISYLAYANVTPRNPNNTSNSDGSDSLANKQFQSAVIVVVVFGVGIITNLCGLWWTGRHPDNSSIKANRSQNCLHRLALEYKNLALVLAQMYHSKNYRSLARQIANQLNIEKIASLVDEMCYLESASTLAGLDDFREVVSFIQKDGKYSFCNQTLRILVFSITSMNNSNS
eukprot:TRINITY_DN11890_c0_g1_i4.p1 TRINITY_DN11890_c0_g1~~TRINITY_DN11890_c0_g1_i4.p1  ORF type:complete len:281 (-),score=42.44 TRINITY_DN11890_c0_g1_i4:55-897(-)